MPSNPACLTRSRPFSNPHSLRIMLSPMAFFIARIIHSMNLAGDTRSLEPSPDGVDYGTHAPVRLSSSACGVDHGSAHGFRPGPDDRSAATFARYAAGAARRSQRGLDPR